MSAPENPFAYPFPDVRDADGCGIMEGSHGMSLRDYFAGQALVGFLANGLQRAVNQSCKDHPDFLDFGPDKRAETINALIADGCYGLADTMLAARAKAVS